MSRHTVFACHRRTITTEQAQAAAAREWPLYRPRDAMQEGETIDAVCKRHRAALLRRLRYVGHAAAYPPFTPGKTTTADYVRMFYAFTGALPLMYATAVRRDRWGGAEACDLPARWNQPAPWIEGPEVIEETES